MLITNSRKRSGRRRRFSATDDNAVLWFILSAGLLTLLVCCAPLSDTPVAVVNRPETRILDLNSSIAMKALKRVLNKKNYTLNSGRTDPRQVETEWLQDGLYRSMVKAEVSPLAKGRCELTFHLILQKKTVWKKSWQPVKEIEAEVYDRFADDVLMEGYRLLYDGS